RRAGLGVPPGGRKRRAAAEPRRKSFLNHSFLEAAPMTERKWFLPEVWFTVALLGLTLAMSAALGFRFSLPAGDRAAFVGIHYLYPLIGVAIWGVLAAFGQRKDLARTFLIA